MKKRQANRRGEYVDRKGESRINVKQQNDINELMESNNAHTPEWTK
jgi:hypothetical protein